MGKIVLNRIEYNISCIPVRFWISSTNLTVNGHLMYTCTSMHRHKTFQIFKGENVYHDDGVRVYILTINDAVMLSTCT